MLGKIAARISDESIMWLLKLILKASGKRGVPQGGPLSPLLSNIYLNEVDKMLERAKEVSSSDGYQHIEYARWADDLVILIDGYRKWDWLASGAYKRLCEELTKLGVTLIYTYAGRKRRMTLGDYKTLSLAEARIKHGEAYKMLKSEEKDPAQVQQQTKIDSRDSSTIGGLIEEYIEKWAKPRKRSWKEDERILNQDVKSKWGNRKAKDITKRDVVLLLEDIVKRGAPIAANRTFACIRRMFNFAVERDLITATPCITIKAPSKENQRDRCLSTDEIKAFWNSLSKASMSEATKIALKLQLVTAQRKGEILGAEWNEIDLETCWWIIPESKAKNGIHHRVPLSKLAIELITELKKINKKSKWLFPSETGKAHLRGESIVKAIHRSHLIFEKVRVQHFTPHDLRRTAATHMTEMGISRLVVSKILNHVDSSITSIYDRHSYDAEKKNALEAWSAKLKQILDSSDNENNVINLTLNQRQKQA